MLFLQLRSQANRNSDNAIVDGDSARAQKRRASSTSNDPSKRPRLSTELSADSPATLRNSPPSPKADSEALRAQRRNSQAQEEKKRGRRLFGGLLNTLSQGNSVTHIKKRQEIEKRQADRAAKAREEDDGRKQEKLEKLKTIRQREAVRFRERTVGTIEILGRLRANLNSFKYATITCLPWQISSVRKQSRSS